MGACRDRSHALQLAVDSPWVLVDFGTLSAMHGLRATLGEPLLTVVAAKHRIAVQTFSVA